MITQKQNKKRQNSFRELKVKIFTFVLLPSIIMLIFSYISQNIYTNYSKNSSKDNYSSFLSGFAANMETNYSSILKACSSFAESDRFASIVANSSQDSDSIEYMKKKILKLKENYRIIDSVAILNKDKTVIYTENGTSGFMYYFNNSNKYEDYNYEYWANLNYDEDTTTILPPTVMTTSYAKMPILPLVLSQTSGKKAFCGQIIINLNLSDVLNTIKASKIFEDTTPSIFNKETMYNYSIDTQTQINNQDLINLTSKKQTSGFDYKLYGQKSYIVSYLPKMNSDYVYMVAIPNSVLTKSMPKAITVMRIMYYLVFLMALFFLLVGSNSLFAPIRKIARLFSINKIESFDELYSAISDTLNTNAKLGNQLQRSLPYVKEQQLIHILNSTEHFLYKNDSTEGLDFPFDFFCSVIVKLNYTDSFYDKYDNISEKTIEIGIYDVIKSEFTLKFDNFYVIPSDDHTLYILLNLEKSDQKGQIDEILNSLKKSFSYDNDDINIISATGSVYSGIKGLKRSHTEALSSISKNVESTHTHLKINTKQIKTKSEIFFSHKDETILYNLLIASSIDNAKTLVDKKLRQFYEKDRSEYEISELYSAIFNTTFKVMKIRNLSYDIDSIGDTALINRIIAQEPAEIQKLLYQYMELLRKNIENKKIDITSIISYIQDNYNKDIYLEGIAEAFDTSTSYLSRLLKKETSSTFSEYLNMLRVNKAKELLSSTKLSIKEIYEQVGFNNRNTFRRVFKNYVGVTPSDFRAEINS